MLLSMQADLHTHTTASDGHLAPADLLARAQAAGVELLAITDHDTVAGVASVINQVPAGLRLVPGIELSAQWRNIGIHVVGLNIDLHNADLNEGIAQQQAARADRAVRIAEKLHRAGFENTLSGAREVAGNANIGRPHFARFLVDSGQIKDISTAFKKHLGRGKPGDIRQGWATMETVVQWIRSANGIAVLAHPAKYKLTNLRLEELCKDFTAASGDALEVISGQQDAALTNRLGRLAQRHGLLASCGSDFHQPGQGWAELGRVAPLPPQNQAVWSTW